MYLQVVNEPLMFYNRFDLNLFLHYCVRNLCEKRPRSWKVAQYCEENSDQMINECTSNVGMQVVI